jgi:nucleoid-associated protein YgaU
MNRDTKIGLLIGLVVIILIGILVSGVLGDQSKTSTGNGQLPQYGQPYREQIQQAPGVAPIINTPVDVAAQPAPLPPSNIEPLNPGNTQDLALAPMTLPNLPTNNLVTSVPMPGLVSGNQTPVNFVAGPVGLNPQPPQPNNVTGLVPLPNKPADTAYVISKGDTLSSIAKKFYKPADGMKLNDAIAKIIKSNPGVLRDANTGLVVGKKLMLPAIENVVVAVNVPATRPATPGTAAPVTTPVVALPRGVLPGTDDSRRVEAGDVGARPVTPEPRPVPVVKTHNVQKGDTLASLAAKYLGNASAANIKKLATANGLKNANELQIGMTLKIPATQG